MKERIFISYKRDDKDVVFKIKDDIESIVGEKCWIDLDGIESDAQFANVIVKSIDEADIFLFMYSKKHAEITDFENDWTVRELNYAREEKKRIVFLNIDGTPLLGWFKLMFSMKQQVDITSTKAMNKFYSDLFKWLGKVGANKADADNNNVNVNDIKEVVYKVRANRACWLYLDDEKIQQLDANKTAKFQLASGVYLRKVVDCEEESVTKEDKITLSEKQLFDDIDLAALYQKYLRRRDSNGIWETCKLFFRQRLGWVISFCLVCAVAVGVFLGYENNEEFIIIVDGHECVDLGLSVKWATCNVGAKTPEEYGDYFAWGETEPKTTYNWSTYKYCVDDSDNLTKYCSLSSYGNNGFTDSKTVLDPEDDAAAVNWGGAWRMPTKEEQDELREKCTWTGTTQNGVYGCKVTGPNGKSIFLPVAGCMIGGSLYAYAYGFYWSSSLFTDCPYYADYLKFYSDGMSLGFYSDGMSEDYYFRAYGYSVRPVCQ